VSSRNDNSDYTKKSTNLFDLLPEVYHSDTSKAIFSNLFNRFLTKQEVQKVAGYIGEGNPNALIKRQIVEPTLQRQTNQLQPIMHTKIGSIDHMASWEDIQRELSRLGVNIDDIDKWGELLQFNWVPPIDIDKLIHFEDYYWYDEATPNSRPQYITIRSRCTVAKANVNFWQKLVDQYGSTFPIIDVQRTDVLPSTSYPIVDIVAVTDTITVQGDVTGSFAYGTFFKVSGTVSNNTTFQVSGSPTYDSVNDSTQIPVATGSIVADETLVGTATITLYDKIVVEGNYVSLFSEGFVFFVADSDNQDLGGSFVEVSSSSYSSSADSTTIVITQTFTDTTISGNASLDEQLSLYLADRDCRCLGSVGWDLLPWDDNPSSPLWGGDAPGEHYTFLQAISQASAPSGAPTNQWDLWYDTTTDILYQYNDSSVWEQIWNRFSLILEKTEGLALWDLTTGCGTGTKIPAAEQWTTQNHWIHKSDVTNFAVAKQAQFPIIEYDWDLELNEWTYTDYRWKYRATTFTQWSEVDNQPSIMELTPLDHWELDSGTDEIVLDERYGDLTGLFVPGFVFQAGTNEAFTVDHSTFVAPTTGLAYQTRITITVPTSTTALSSGNILQEVVSSTPLQPITTAQGDAWLGYGQHWVFTGALNTLPITHQPINPFVELPVDAQMTLPVASVNLTGGAGVNYFEVEGKVDKLFTSGTTFTIENSAANNATYTVVGTGSTYSDPLGSPAGTGYTTIPVAEVIPSNTAPLGDILASAVFVDVSGDFDYSVGYYAQTYTIQSTSPVYTLNLSDVILPGSRRSLRNRALIGYDDVRVYINNIRQYGSYDELTIDGTYVSGIQFLSGYEPNRFDVVRIEVGEASIDELGLYSIPVRMVEDDAQYLIDGNVTVSLIRYKKAEQVKTSVNQYPQFDIYHVTGLPKYDANPIFGYRTSPDAAVNVAIGQRTVYDSTTRNYEFDQFLLEEDDGTLYAYRDYSNIIPTYWFNTLTQQLLFWTGTTWSSKKEISGYYLPAYVSDIEPSNFYLNVDGAYWFDTLNQILWKRNVALGEWDVITSVVIAASDTSLQTIWKKGLNDETYVPAKVDWEGRTEIEYDAAQTAYVTTRAAEIVTQSNATTAEANAQALDEWYQKQSNVHSPTGVWVGDWELPDPMYYNVLNENRKYLDTRQLITHFSSIIQEQPTIPGYVGTKESMFHLISNQNINYGLGGKIKQYNKSFDTLLSAIFVDTVTPLSVIDFAHDLYDSSLTQLKEIYRKHAISLLTSYDQQALSDLSLYIANEVITQYEQDDNNAFVFGDSTTFTEVIGGTDLGIRNWIATLPYLRLTDVHMPEFLVDELIDLIEIVHHDGHRAQYKLTDATLEGIIHELVGTGDPRTSFPTPSDAPLDTFGRTQNYLPPNTIDEFETEFSTVISNREGVFWYFVNQTTRTLYRLNLVSIGTTAPLLSDYADGALWLDMTAGAEVLRIKVTSATTGVSIWEVVDGLTPGDKRLHNGTDSNDVTTSTISAWQPLSLNVILGKIIYEAEHRLYENAPDVTPLRYDVSNTETKYPTTYDQYMYEAFLDYATQHSIEFPFANTSYSSSDPFTWNYKFSTIGHGFQIVEADSATNSFIVTGDATSLLDPCTSDSSCPSVVAFYIKNSSVNSGTWTTISSTALVPATVYDAVNNTTTVYVQETVTNDNEGIVYVGTLPSSINDGSESGGDWRDLYAKLYGTPYPHLEPWALQGYITKPSWWDAQYLNDDSNKWGDRTWKYKHGFELVSTNATEDYIEILGDFREVFAPTLTVPAEMTGSPSSFTFTATTTDTITGVTIGGVGTAVLNVSGNVTNKYAVGRKLSVVSSSNTVTKLVTVKSRSFSSTLNTTYIVVEEAIDSSTGIDFVGTIYDPTTNRLRVDVTQNLTTSGWTGRVLIAYGMWENIRVGIIPAGETYSNGITSITGNPATDSATYNLPVPIIPTYNYFSVNVSNGSVSSDGGTTIYYSDDVLPPYWDYTVQYGITPLAIDLVVRSVFLAYATEIVSPGAAFVFGDAGTVEWEWRNSSQYLYDLLTVSFRLDPIAFMSDTFGAEIITVNGLEVDLDKENVPSHTRTTFHGEIINDAPYLTDSINQWYVDYNRFSGLDVSSSDFRNMWTQWTAPLTYQFSSFIDTPSLSVGHRYIDITSNDYSLIAKKSPGTEDYWLDAFNISFANVPPKVVRYNNQLDWRVSINTNLDISRTIEYYDVRNYQFYADPTTDICTLYTWEIVDASLINKTFSVSGDQTLVFAAGRTFAVTNSTDNDGTYTVKSSSYDVVSDATIIEVDESLTSSFVTGFITANYRTIPWSTGDGIYLSSTETLPIPLLGDTVNGLTKYFIIVESDTTFKLARTYQDAIDGTAIDLLTPGKRDHYIGQVINTFNVIDGQQNILWRHYELDTQNVLSFNTPHDVQGLQTVINIIDGYSKKRYEEGWRINDENSQLDPVSGQIVTWQSEIERFLTNAFNQRDRRYVVTNRHEATVDVLTNEWTFVDTSAQYVTGDRVTVFSSNGAYPTPIVRGVWYYIIRDTADTFRLAASLSDANSGIEINVTDATSVDKLYITSASESTPISSHEINPIRHAIWFKPARGIVSNVVEGPTEDVRATQLIFDQYGRRLGSDTLRIFREDTRTAIKMLDNIANDVKPYSTDPRDNIHMGGAHLFVDSYEQVLKFEDYTSDGTLIYDPFIGLNLTKFEMLFNRDLNFTGRPNVGGYYLETFHNQELELKRNIEAGVEDLRTMYDTYSVLESSDLVSQARKVLGYEGPADYLRDINVNDKSQFLFWKGMIQHKGSINAVNAFINSHRFIEANVDEYWAYKVASFGSAKEKEYPELYVTANDTLANDIRLQFTSDLESPDSTFIAISAYDDQRWFNQPDQLQTLSDNNNTLYFDIVADNMIPVTVSSITGSPVTPTSPVDNQGLVLDGNLYGSPQADGNHYFYRWNSVSSVWDQHGSWVAGNNPVIRHDFDADTVSLTVRRYAEGTKKSYAAAAIITLAEEYIPFTNSIEVFRQGQKLIAGVDYNEVPPVSGSLTSSSITLTNPTSLGSPDNVEIVYTTATLIRGIHFEMINSNIIRILFPALVSSTYIDLKVWGLDIDKGALAPAKLIDKKAEVVLTTIPMWDPARGYHYPTAFQNVDLANDVDPARYSVTPQQKQSATLGHPVFDPWGSKQVGNTWLNTFDLSYVPYYDEHIITSVEDRLRQWGRLSDWSDVELYEWIKSDVPPDQYDTIAAIEEGDATIAESKRKSGRAKQTLFKNGGASTEVRALTNTATTGQTITGSTSFKDTNATFISDEVTVGDIIRLTGSNTGDWRITSVSDTEVVLDATVPLVGDTNISYTIYKPIWTMMQNVYDKHDVVISGTFVSNGVYSFVTNIPVGETVNVYVNGILSQENVVVTSSPISVTCTENDIVIFANLLPTEAEITAGEADGTLLYDYEYTTDIEIDKFGTSQTVYYFWVRQKSTKVQGKNRTMSSKDTEAALKIIPSPYMFFQKTMDSNWHQYTQSFTYAPSVSPLPASTTFTVDHIILSNVVTVTIDGVAVPANIITVDVDNYTFSLPTSQLSVGQIVKIEYTGLNYTENKDLPSRFVQSVVRGLRGWIDDDRRYTVRFTRDFTLRDDLNKGTSSLDLKNKHEEWIMFRERQPYHIDRVLWDKVTEAMVGYKTLIDGTIERVPSYERELYDSKYGTDTRYGLGDNQAIVDGSMALDTIIADLENPDNVFHPVDINTFFEQHNFDTDAAIIESMDVIYNTFAYTHVNRMMFSVLHDALSLKTKYPDILKTSMVSLNGIKPLQISGIFDD